MLINATRAQQLRVAIVDGTILQEYQVEIAEKGLSRGNIYRGVVANLQPSLNAAFIDIGEERHGFLPVADVLPSAYHKKPPADVKRPRVDQVLEKGKPILVQVTKDGVGQKGAALSTNLALAGRYLVFTPFDAVRGISRKASDDEARKTVRKRLQKLDLPDGHGVIVRTNGIDQNQATLNRDLNALLRLWRKIRSEGERGRGAKLIYSDQDLVVQALRDYLDPEISEVIVDSDSVHSKAESFMKAFMPRSKTVLTRYDDRLPLFSRYRLETQIDRIYERAAPLPSGGYLVIDQTEALTAIDVNSGRATRTSNHDESILKINVEAAREVARQLRLRDIGGLIVVDFIDMRLRKHQNKLERTMRDAMKPDKARWSVGRISSNGLLEINRQRIKQALRLRSHHQCPTCDGTGTIPTPEFAAMRLLSKIEARASTQNMASVTIGLHPQMADELQNHYRRDLAELETTFDLEIEIIAAPNLKRTEERIEWVQREGAAPSDAPAKRSAAVSAVDLAPAKKRRRRKSASADDEKVEASTQRGQRGGKSSRGDESAPADDEPKKTTSSRRRRRRRRKSADSDADAQQTAAGATTEGAAESSAETATEGDAETSRRSKSRSKEDDSGTRSRRRRRSRSRGRGRGDAQDVDAAEEQTAESAEATEASTSPADGGTSGDETDTDTPTRTTRRRRSRRRRSKRSEADAPEHDEAALEVSADEQAAQDDDTAMSDAEVDAEPDSEAPTRRRRRRSRSRRRKVETDASADAAVEDGEALEASDPDTGDVGDDTGPGDDTVESATADDEAPRTRTRTRKSRARRSRDRVARPDTDDASDDLAETESAEAEPEDPTLEAEAADAAAATRARRKRRRRSTRARAEDNGDGPAAETDSEPTAAAPVAEEPEPAPPAIEPPPIDAPPRRPELSPHLPSDEPAADGESPNPPTKRRWQWWGTPSDPAPEPSPDASDSDD